MESETTWALAAANYEKLVGKAVANLGIAGESAKDAKQVGLMELEKVVGKYDPSKGPFPAFCYRVVIRKLIKHRKSTHMIRVPNSTLEKIKSGLVNPSAKYKASAETIAAADRAMKLRFGRVDDAPCQSGSQVDQSYDPPTADDATAEVDRRDEIEMLRQAVLKVPVRARQMFVSAHGLFGCPAEPLDLIAAENEIDVDRVKKILAATLLDVTRMLAQGREETFDETARVADDPAED